MALSNTRKLIVILIALRQPSLKKQFLKRKFLYTPGFLVQWFILICFFSISACNLHSSSHTTNDTAERLPAIIASRHASLMAPKITYITALNKPMVLKAGKPLIIIDPSKGGAPFITNYDIEQGLPVNNIICSATDKYGNLWFGTGGGGVSRFDGKSFTNYSMAQGLAGNNVLCIMEDKEGNIWIGTTSGLSKYDGNQFINFRMPNGLGGNFITAILQDSKGNIWLGTHDGGISEFDGKSFTNYSIEQGLADNYVRCLLQDREGNIWLGTEAGGVSKYDGHNFKNITQVQGLAGNSVNCIIQDNENNLWFGTNAGLSKYNGTMFTNYTTKKGLADNNVTCMMLDKNGILWLGFQSKNISRYDGARFTNYSSTEKLEDYKVRSILQDHNGNVWISSQGGGVSKYEGNSFRNYTMAKGLPANLVFWIIQDKTGNIWIGTYDGGVSKYDGRSFTKFTKAQGLADNKIWSMMLDKAGNLWFGTDRGLSKFNGTSFTNYTTKQGLANDAVISMMEDKSGNLWFGTRANGVSKFDGFSFTNYTATQGLAGNNIWNIIQDKAGNIWFASHDGGVSKYDGRNFNNYTTAEGLTGNAVTAILQDKNGILWFGTDGNGISKFDGKLFTNYTTQQGLADNGVSNIREDTSRNIIWFGTNKGLSGLNENKLHNRSKLENQFQNFNKSTGYPLKDVSTGALLVDDKGLVWMGSGDGKLISFDYSKVNDLNPSPLTLQIQAVRINNETICWNDLLHSPEGSDSIDSLTLLNEMVSSFGKVLSKETLLNMRKKYRQIQLDGIKPFYPVPVNLVLPYDDNSITIEFAAIEPALPKLIKYQYKLEGYNNDWSSPGNNSTAVFGNLKAGNYIFRLKALSSSGVWSETKYTFQVLPPWWATWWAYALYIFLVGSIGYTLYQMHIESLKRKQAEKLKVMIATQEEERKRISRDLHDDIGAKLTNINMLSALGQKKVNGPQEMAEYLQRISGEIQTSAESLDDIVWNIESKNDAIEEITARMRRYAAHAFEGTSVVYTIETNEQSLPAKLSTGMRRDLFFVFKEAINNIQKHAMATEVNINIEGKGNELFMQVSDNGIGFQTGEPTHRNGLKIIRERMQKWGGVCLFDSSPGKGALLKITLPVEGPSLKKGMWDWLKRS
jgi:ligand-binding sensor domain-containing protein/signal transduction histidine kinase